MPLNKSTSKWIGLTFICSGVQISRSTDFTRLICVPIPRWIPEQRMHRKTPLKGMIRPEQKRKFKAHKFHDAQRGSALKTASENLGDETAVTNLPFRLQSAQTLLSCCLTSSLRILAFLSVVALSCLDMMDDESLRTVFKFGELSKSASFLKRVKFSATANYMHTPTTLCH